MRRSHQGIFPTTYAFIHNCLLPYLSPKVRRVSSIVTENGISSALSLASFCDIMAANDMGVLATPEAFNIFDINKSGKVDYYEYMLNIASLRVDHNLSNPEEEAKMYFQIFDIDNDGSIVCDEFKGVMHHLIGSSNETCNANFNEIQSLFEHLETNHGINIDEFKIFYKSLLLSTRSR